MPKAPDSQSLPASKDYVNGTTGIAVVEAYDLN